MVILDTNIIIDHLRYSKTGESMLLRLVKKIPKEELAISVLTVQELYEGISTRDKQKEEHLLITISPLKVLSYSYEVAQLAGEIARDLKRSIEFVDAAIAATTIINGGELLTLNRKDFVSIDNFRLYELKL